MDTIKLPFVVETTDSMTFVKLPVCLRNELSLKVPLTLHSTRFAAGGNCII